jgi:CheY-like chemotaxis protein
MRTNALKLVVRIQPALVISDIAMPGKDGFLLLQEIRSLDLSGGGEVPVIAITGLSRPLDQSSFLSGIRKWHGRKRQGRSVCP